MNKLETSACSVQHLDVPYFTVENPKVASNTVSPQTDVTLNVCFVTNEYPANRTCGAGVYAWNLTKALAQQGHNVHVLTWGTSDIESVKNLHVHRLNLSSSRSFPSCVNQLFFLLSIPFILARLHKNTGGIDVIHANAQFFSAIISLLAASHLATLSRVPKLITVHHLDHYEFLIEKHHPSKQSTYLKRLFSKLIEAITVRKADAILTVSNFTKLSLTQVYSVPKRRIFAIPNGLKPLIETSNLTIERGNQIFMLSIGRMEPRKGFPIILNAFRILAEKYPSLHLILVGRGIKNGCREFTSGFEKRITVYEHLDDAQLASMYNICDIYVSASLLEGFGLTILEAMAAGKPVIATRSGGVPEFVEDKANGLLIEPNNIQALVNAVSYLVEHKTLGQKMGQNNKEHVKRHFRWEVTAENTINAYRAVIYELVVSKSRRP